MFGSRDFTEIRARLTRLEAKVDLMLEALGVQLEAGQGPEAAQIQALLDAGQKIAAIKQLRMATGMGLAEAKRAVEDGSWVGLLPGGRG